MIRHWTWFGGPKLAASVLAVFLAAIGADGASSQSNRTIKIVITFPADAKADMTFLPGSTAAAISGLASQKVAGAIQLFLNVQGQLRTDKVRALAITSRARKEVLPDVPTVAESGFPDYEVEYWDGIYAPAGASQKTLDQLAGWFGAAARSPAVKATLAAQTYVPVGVCGPEFITFIHKELERYGRVISEAGIRGE
jgi:tripartite-type tricarboxylate transporter receptor subunit TctC